MTFDEEISNLAYLPNGNLNASFILANGKILFEEKELALAVSLFRLLKDDKKLGHCAHYGLGQCFFAANDFAQAVKAYEKALSLSKKSYIAKALLEALMANKQYPSVEKKALQFVVEFTNEPEFVQEVRKIYYSSIENQKNNS